MKKFVVLLIVLVLLGGAGFFVGWAGLTLPLGSVGVLRSKTHGVDPAVIEEGTFRWVWYRLIPTNAKVLPFTLKPKTGELEISGGLSQGDTYKTFAKNANFAWKLGLAYRFSIKPEHLPALVRDKNIENDEDLEKYEADIASGIESRARKFSITRELFENLSSPTLESEIRTAFPEIEFLEFRWKALVTPDFALYESGKALYDQYIERQRALLESNAAEEAARNITSQFRFDELERYGELLSKYPSLMEYIQLEKR
ncbi:MAG: hypothetical protein LBG27_11395 [Spirochaetaceae bacterium]|jgi:hypothetical protein|nr:hypothetical protein [Spirochaetaceae bacterium]